VTRCKVKTGIVNKNANSRNMNYHMRDVLQNQGDDKTGQFLASIMRFQFIIALVIAEHILHITVYLSTFLQDTDYDILKAIKESTQHDHQLICLQHGAVDAVHGSGFPI
jgi:hypothetical protein